MSTGATGETGATGDTGATRATGARGATGAPAPIHPWRWRALTVWVVVFTLITAWAVNRGNQAHDGLCAIRDSNVEQVKEAEHYLDRLRAGEVEPIPGFSQADVIASIRRQRNTVDTINGKVHC